MSFYPTKYKDYSWIKERKYTTHDLLSICDFFTYPIKRKKKKDMIEDCHSYLRRCYFATILQKYMRKKWIREFKRSQGPACFKRTICNNAEDFLTTESMREMDYYFFTSVEENGFVYGFNIISVYNLLIKKTPMNPYTRTPLSDSFVQMIHRRMKLNVLLQKTDHPIYHEIQIPRYNSKITDLFQKMDSLGNYTQIEWFFKLTTSQLRRFILELHDIWDYRAQLPTSIKMRICPPLGKPFLRVPVHTLENSATLDLQILHAYCYSIMDELLNRADLVEHQCLGSYYILCALTLVSQEVADAMPWLYQSVV